MPGDSHDLVIPEIRQFKQSRNPLMPQVMPSQTRKLLIRDHHPERMRNATTGLDRDNWHTAQDGAVVGWQ